MRVLLPPVETHTVCQLMVSDSETVLLLCLCCGRPPLPPSHSLCGTTQDEGSLCFHSSPCYFLTSLIFFISVFLAAVVSVSPTQRSRGAAVLPQAEAALTLTDTVWNNGCANIMQMQREHITASDGRSHLWHVHRETSINRSEPTPKLTTILRAQIYS